MDIGGADLVGVDDDLVDQLDDGAVRFLFLARFVVLVGLVDRAGVLVGRQLLEQDIDVGTKSVGVLDAGEDFVAETNLDGDFAIGFDRPQGIGALNIVRIVDHDNQVRTASLMGTAQIFRRNSTRRRRRRSSGICCLAENL